MNNLGLLILTVLLVSMVRPAEANGPLVRTLEEEENLFLTHGPLVRAVTTAHFLGTLDWEQEETNFWEVRDALKGIEKNLSEKAPVQVPWAAELDQTIELWEQTNLLLFNNRGEKNPKEDSLGKRVPRQAIAATVTVVAAAVTATMWIVRELHSLDSRLKALEMGRQARLMTIQGLQTDNVATIKALNVLRSALGKSLTVTRKSLWKLSVVSATKQYLTQLRQKCFAVREGIAGAWPSSLLPEQHLRESLTALYDRLKLQNREPVVPGIRQLLTARTILARKGKEVRFVALIPTKPRHEEWTLMELANMPRKGNSTTLFTLNLPSHLIAVNSKRDETLPIRTEELQLCTTEEGQILCPMNLPRYRSNTDNCLHKLVTGQTEANCPTQRWLGQMWSREASKTSFAIFSRKSTELTVRCPDREDSFLSVKGRTLLQLQPGCAADSETMTMEVPEEAPHVQSAMIQASKLPSFHPPPSLLHLPPPVVRATPNETYTEEEVLTELSHSRTGLIVPWVLVLVLLLVMVICGMWIRRLRWSNTDLRNTLQQSIAMIETALEESTDEEERRRQQLQREVEVQEELQRQLLQEVTELEREAAGLPRQATAAAAVEAPGFQSSLPLPPAKRKKVWQPKRSFWKPQAASTPRPRPAPTAEAAADTLPLSDGERRSTVAAEPKKLMQDASENSRQHFVSASSKLGSNNEDATSASQNNEQSSKRSKGEGGEDLLGEVLRSLR